MRHLAIALLLLAACAPQAPQTAPAASDEGFQNLEPQQVQELLGKKEELGLFVLNVHTPYEGELGKTDAIIQDWENIAAHTDKLPLNKSTPVLVYCRTGRMSLSAIKQLKTLGYTNLYHLKGGMKAWDAAGLPVINKTFGTSAGQNS